MSGRIKKNMSENDKAMTLEEFTRQAVIKSNSSEERILSPWKTVLVCPDLNIVKTCVELLSENAENGMKYMYMISRAEEIPDAGSAATLKSEFPLDGQNIMMGIRSRGLKAGRQVEDLFYEFLSLLNSAHEDGFESGMVHGRADVLADMVSALGDEIDALDADLDAKRLKHDDDNSKGIMNPEGGKA